MSVRRAPRCPGVPPAPDRLHAVLSAGVAQGCATKPFAPAARPRADGKLRKAFKAQLAICAGAGDGAAAAAAPDGAAAAAAADSEAMLANIEEALRDGHMSAKDLAGIIKDYDVELRGHLATIEARDRKIDELAQEQRQLQQETTAATAELERQLAACKEREEYAERTIEAVRNTRKEARKETDEVRKEAREETEKARSERDTAKAQRLEEIQKSDELARVIADKQTRIEELQNDRETLRNKTKNTRKNMLILSLTAGLAYTLWQNFSQNDPSASCQLLQERENIRLAHRYGYGGPGAM